MKKVWFFNLFVGSLFGDATGEPEIGMLARRIDQKKTCTPYETYRLPSNFNGLSTFAEYLFWQVQEQASHFVITPNKHSTLVLAGVAPDLSLDYLNTEGLGRIRSAHFKWGSGVRVGLSYTTKHDAWQVVGQYTWFATEGKKNYSITPTSSLPIRVLMPTFYVQSPITTTVETDTNTGIASASNEVHFSYQMADFLAARAFLMTKHIRLNFSFGGTGGYIKEDFHTIYFATAVTTAGVTTPPNNTYIKNDWSFGGGGFRVALDSNWHMGNGVGLFGRCSFAPILGHYSNTNRITADSPVDQIGPSIGTGVPAYLANTKYTKILLIPTTQIVLGFDWYRAFINCNINAVRVAFAVEFNNLPRLQQTFREMSVPVDFTNGRPGWTRDFSSVYLYGADVRVGVDY